MSLLLLQATVCSKTAGGQLRQRKSVNGPQGDKRSNTKMELLVTKIDENIEFQFFFFFLFLLQVERFSTPFIMSENDLRKEPKGDELLLLIRQNSTRIKMKSLYRGAW